MAGNCLLVSDLVWNWNHIFLYQTRLSRIPCPENNRKHLIPCQQDVRTELHCVTIMRRAAKPCLGRDRKSRGTDGGSRHLSRDQFDARARDWTGLVPETDSTYRCRIDRTRSILTDLPPRKTTRVRSHSLSLSHSLDDSYFYPIPINPFPEPNSVSLPPKVRIFRRFNSLRRV